MDLAQKQFKILEHIAGIYHGKVNEYGSIASKLDGNQKISKDLEKDLKLTNKNINSAVKELKKVEASKTPKAPKTPKPKKPKKPKAGGRKNRK